MGPAQDWLSTSLSLGRAPHFTQSRKLRTAHSSLKLLPEIELWFRFHASNCEATAQIDSPGSMRNDVLGTNRSVD